jgi:guanine deaminase
MTDGTRARAIRATIMHTPTRGAVEIVEDALVEVDAGGAIVAVTPPSAPDFAARTAAAAAAGTLERLGAHQYLLPGLVDLHIHAPQWPQLGKALHLPLDRWLTERTFPLEARYRDTDFARRVYRSMVDALVAGGTTTAVYFGTIHREANRVLAEICLEKGQRAFVGKVAMDEPALCPPDYRDASAAAAIAETEDLIHHIRALPGNAAGLVRPIVTPRFIPACTDALLEGLGDLARRCGCHVQTHCSESDWAHRTVIERLGKTDTRALADFGLITRQTVLAHGNFIGDEDAGTLRDAGSGIAHCPLSNFYFANAVLPARRLVEGGVHVGLGSDVSGGPSASIFDACRTAVAASIALDEGTDPAKAASARGRPGSRLDFRGAFYLATVGGGEVLDLKVGKFAPGYRFDAIAVDTLATGGGIHVFDDIDDLQDVFQKIVYGATPANIAAVWVDGRRL